MYAANSAHVSADTHCTHTPPATNNQLRRTGVHQKVGMRLVVTEGSTGSDDAGNVTRCVVRWPAASTHHLDPSSVSMVSWELYVPTTKFRVISRNAGTMLGRPVATVVMYGTRSQLGTRTPAVGRRKWTRASPCTPPERTCSRARGRRFPARRSAAGCLGSCRLHQTRLQTRTGNKRVAQHNKHA